ncbi:RagB/SusD family nutrient uptake outer membrane protein [Zobellia galactanivorans]|uniref:RagB/SusD family nutrient uptake outer membrane protein n=1 Tax=Zobellia galactanivorans (strain DSM 12802 / CCUG 47099 / CIP 106680 / NCIMB 13871 / Dsij) TaxID=63186 RepID=UPI001C075226|nr:RagB/SusD family nutrient uptake outer membrane protein [Zobellia galactanivorans]MBU3024725.1 RagB/SusD family nutrient uptake outer membrane protein [Zobellia galactanivorans]MDO6810655.1 RagB/SusD family nutrient uptake outer membrane protein [Zobellia galactanivorans]
MKNYKKILSLILMAGIFSCSDDILDKDPQSGFSASGFYQTSSDAQAGVYGIYDAVQSTFSLNFSFWGEGRADAVDTNHSGDPLLMKQNALNKTMTSARWNNLYETISRANYAIKYVPGVFESGNDFSNQLVGQARALRALSYFYAVRVWGDVPMILEPYESSEQGFFVEKTDKEAILDQIEADLLFAADNCRESFGGERDRLLITQGSAYALLTQVYMWRNKYEEAVDAAEKVMGNSLYSLVGIGDWSKIFSTGFSNESIFEIGYDETQTNNLRVLYALGSDSHYFPSETFRNSFEEGDLRMDLIYDVTAEQPKKIWKFFGQGFNDESPDPSDKNIVMVRLADIMLLKAEAHNKLGQVNEALGLLNIIRTRAGLAELTQDDAISAYGDVESAILHERSIELSFEGHRWFDLVRTGKAIEVMKPINGLSDEANLVWPLHEDALNRNPKLVQNAFY